jgi:hypothetical protein
MAEMMRLSLKFISCHFNIVCKGFENEQLVSLLVVTGVTGN